LVKGVIHWSFAVGAWDPVVTGVPL
jgi:hypothetical protein